MRHTADPVLRQAWFDGQQSQCPEPPQNAKFSTILQALTAEVQRAYPSTRFEPLVSPDANREDAVRALTYVEGRLLEIFSAEVHAKLVANNANLKTLANAFFKPGTSSSSGHNSYHPLTGPADIASGDTDQRTLDRINYAIPGALPGTTQRTECHWRATTTT
jgi:hypothetical protein